MSNIINRNITNVKWYVFTPITPFINRDFIESPTTRVEPKHVNYILALYLNF